MIKLNTENNDLIKNLEETNKTFKETIIAIQNPDEEAKIISKPDLIKSKINMTSEEPIKSENKSKLYNLNFHIRRKCFTKRFY